MPCRLACGECVPPDLEAAAKLAKSDWSRFDNEKLLVLLEGTYDEPILRGTVLGRDGSESPLAYRRTRGLETG